MSRNKKKHLTYFISKNCNKNIKTTCSDVVLIILPTTSDIKTHLIETIKLHMLAGPFASHNYIYYSALIIDVIIQIR